MYVALNISNSNIQVLSLKGKQVKKWGNFPLAEGLVRDGLVLQPQAVAEAVETLFKTTKISRENVVVSLAGMSFTYRFLTLPRLKPALVEEALLRAARKEISLPLDELYLSWYPVPGKGDEQEYFVLGVPRNLVDTILQTLSLAGIEPSMMELRPLALARTAVRNDAVVVNMQPDCFDIVFIAGGIPRVIHTISPRSEGATLEDNIRRLADELSKTAAFYQSSHPDTRMGADTPLLLTGELSAEAPTRKLLQDEVEYAVETLVPTVECPSELPVEAFTASIGLALKKTPTKPAGKGEEVRFHDININILAARYRKKKTKPVPAGYIMLGILLAVAVIALYPLYQARSHLAEDNAALQTALNGIERQINLAVLIDEQTTVTEDYLAELIEETEVLDAANYDILSNRGEYSSNLQELNEALPAGVLFTSVEIDNFKITARGETDSVFNVVEYAQALEATGAFTEVRIALLDEDASIASEVEETEAVPEGEKVIIFEISVDK